MLMECLKEVFSLKEKDEEEVDGEDAMWMRIDFYVVGKVSMGERRRREDL